MQYVYNRLSACMQNQPSNQLIVMHTLFTWLVITGVLFLLFLVLLFTGIRKKSMGFIYAALIAFLLAGISGLYTGYIFISRSYTKVTETFRPRTGMEIYTALFRPPPHDCVTITHYLDPVIPRIDCCIWLEFRTCPAELRRIIDQQPYQAYIPFSGDSAASYIPDYGNVPDWWQPRKLGNNMNALQYSKDSNRQLTLLFNADSTHALYCDMAD